MKSRPFGNLKSVGIFLMGSTALAASGTMTPAFAQATPPAPTAEATAPVAVDQIKSITVVGTQRLEGDTVRSYIRLRTGQPWTQVSADQALKDLYATELFADVAVRNNSGAVVIEVRENPVVNRIILEGNKRIKNDKIEPEIKLAPRQIYSRSKVRADVARIVELYKRQGRFAAVVEPKLVQLDQNRVDIVFEITEGPKSKVQQINIIGNEKFSDGDLRGEMVTKQSRFYRFFSSGTSYDPDRLAFDQQKLRQFYLTQGYADFRVVSAIAELTPDKQDFIITYVVEEGDRYKFGDVKVESQIRDFDSERLTATLRMKKGDWYNAKMVEDTVESLSETAGLFGYAFADVNPDFQRDKETLTMGITFNVAESPRVFVERIDINGNTLTQDKVVRREFRLNEGDAFNSIQVKRTAERIKSLGYFQEELEVEQVQGGAADRIVLTTNVEEKATGELSLSAGFSSIENFIFQGSVRQRNFRGVGQELRTNISYSSYSKSAEIGFTEPYLFDRSIAVSGDIFRRDLNSFNFFNNQRNTTYEQATTGFQLRVGVPVNEYVYFQARYGLSQDNISLDENTFFTDPDGTGPLPASCDPIVAGRFLCDATGKRLTSSLGYTLLYDDRDNRIRPTRGQSIGISQDFAGLGGSVKYVKTRINADKFWKPFGNFVFGLSLEGGYIHPLESRGLESVGVDSVRLTDRFYLGEPQMRGFDIRGIGPRVQRVFFQSDIVNGVAVNTALTDRNQIQDDAIGGRAYYMGRAELQIPLGSGARELGLRPSLFLDVGSVFDVTRPILQTVQQREILSDGTQGAPLYYFVDTTGTLQTSTTATNADGSARISALRFEERFYGDTWKPRLSVGFGVNWNSPFGPFRLDIARALLKQPGDDTKLFTFNVGTQF
ncbi:MAG TPA: outer membrane protein assembly factor BamA [Sphingorhabdus sp.]|jgi:outer membrane protein insertion porin family|uniref:outer membrane protein assembly factor BamA n=1 Tax=Sphingorhabdus sp. TaxID=1902408 RepID=UPI00269BCF5F|nr:outer membrane protein assembly factor BamA [Sphingorhabdus sp.]HQS11923.1 outer membrane protein assembly factor BamA [Sphingorhabdus sp.]HQS79265.1 outer membrane protein assembly factor BamA [Sphingorhabdus sp.]